MNTQLKIDRARYWALSHPTAVFYGSLAQNLADVIDAKTPTASTNGKVIRWNPAKVEAWTDEEVRFVLLHETLHCAHGHFWRLPVNADGNRAGDYAINAVLSTIPGIKMPEGGLLDEQFDGLAEEEILARLLRTKEPSQPGKPDDAKPDDAKPDEGAGGGDPGECGGFEAPAPDAPAPDAPAPDAPAPAPDGEGQGEGEGEGEGEGDEGIAPAATLREQWERNLVQADQARRAAGCGDLPADLQRLVDAVKAETAIDWRQETAEFLRSAIATRNDWTRSARRHALAATIIPRRRVNNVGTVVIVRDTSGSIDDRILSEFNAQVEASIADLGCEVLLIDADSRVAAEYRIGPGDDIPGEAKGGGGTDFRPVFARVQELADEGETFAGLVYLTDLDGPEPTIAEVGDLPVLWVCTTESVADTGRTIAIEV